MTTDADRMKRLHAMIDEGVKCPNCESDEWFPGASCWDCGWEAEEGGGGHLWSRPWKGVSKWERLGIKTPVCLRCGYVKRADGANRPCSRSVRVGPRS